MQIKPIEYCVTENHAIYILQWIKNDKARIA